MSPLITQGRDPRFFVMRTCCTSPDPSIIGHGFGGQSAGFALSAASRKLAHHVRVSFFDTTVVYGVGCTRRKYRTTTCAILGWPGRPRPSPAPAEQTALGFQTRGRLPMAQRVLTHPKLPGTYSSTSLLERLTFFRLATFDGLKPGDVCPVIFCLAFDTTVPTIMSLVPVPRCIAR